MQLLRSHTAPAGELSHVLGHNEIARGYGASSNAPMSHTATPSRLPSCGLATPRWSVDGQLPDRTASIA
jgi:hypothetical protein